MSTKTTIRKLVRMWVCLALLFVCPDLAAQKSGYTIKDGRMFIAVDKTISDAALDSFIVQFDLADLGLRQLVKGNKADSILKQGWKVLVQNETAILISKGLEALENFDNPINKIRITEKHEDPGARFPAVSNAVKFGYNRFRNKESFHQKDSIVAFYLRNNLKAQKVYLAGSFNEWSPDAQAMKKTDSGWIAYVKLAPGKYWYKFVVDGHWITDTDNQLRENDGKGNINSVFFKTNNNFILEGHTNARNVFVAGSFNNWKPKDLRMNRTATGWEFPVYLANGTHMYKFISDGNWMPDTKNPEQAPDGTGGINSVISLGNKHVFTLKGFDNAKNVMLAGTFNQWRDFELPLKKTQDGWIINYVLGPGNYEYKFIVDGKWIADPHNQMTPDKEGNSFLIIEPNYTFQLKDFKDARQVFVAGDFNGWNPEAFPMKRTAEGWTFQLHIPPGKTRYKFVVDGKWILDPGNKLWEQNEFGTGNSLIWR